MLRRIDTEAIVCDCHGGCTCNLSDSDVDQPGRCAPGKGLRPAE